MTSKTLRVALRSRLASLADWLTIVRPSRVQSARYVFHPMGVIRVDTPELHRAELASDR